MHLLAMKRVKKGKSNAVQYVCPYSITHLSLSFLHQRAPFFVLSEREYVCVIYNVRDVVYIVSDVKYVSLFVNQGYAGVMFWLVCRDCE